MSFKKYRFFFQKVGSVWIVVQLLLRYGDGMGMVTISAMPAVFTIKWMDRTDLLSSLREDWYVDEYEFQTIELNSRLQDNMPGTLVLIQAYI